MTENSAQQAHGRRGSLALGFLTTLLAACMAPRPAGMHAVPDSLAVPQDQVLAVAAHGIGTQIYECRPGTDPASFAWMLKAPDAQLRYEAGKELGTHYAGPTWEAYDGSKVVGDVVARDPGPDADAIPWLLLRATQASGHGIFGAVQFIQRLHTAGGKAPLAGCDQAYAGTEVRVAYSADYYFYVTRR